MRRMNEVRELLAAVTDEYYQMVTTEEWAALCEKWTVTLAPRSPGRYAVTTTVGLPLEAAVKLEGLGIEITAAR